jgi:drug/metabolite transporter (DMT)-like permease
MIMNPKTKAAAMLAFSALAWGALFPVAKDALASIEPFHLSALRYVPAAIAMLAVVAAVEGRRALRLDGAGLRLWLYGSLGFAGFSNLAMLGIRGTTPEHAAIIVSLLPFVTALIAWLTRGRRPTAATVISSVIAFVGVLIVITRGRLHLSTDVSWGADAMVLAGVCCWSGYTSAAATFPQFSPLRYTALSMALGALTIVALTLAAAALGAPTPSVSEVIAVGPEVAYLSAIAGVLAVLAWNDGIGVLGPTAGSLFINLVPITAFAIAIAQGRRIGAAEVAGVLLTLGALVGSHIAARASSAPAGAVVARSPLVRANR